MEARLYPIRLTGHPVSRQSVATALFGGLTWLLLTPNALFAEAPTIELSPLVAKSTLLAPLDGNKQISVLLALPLSDPKGAADFIQQVSTRGTALYHQYLTPQQFADRFGGNAADYAALKEWAVAEGLQVSQESVGRINLTVRASVTQLQTIFKTQLNAYRSPDGQEFFSASVKPTVPDAIATKICAVIGLTGGKQYAPQFKIANTLGESPPEISAGDSKTTNGAGGTGPGGTYSAQDLRTVYSIPDFGYLNMKTVVAVFEQGGFDPSDVIRYFDRNKLPRRKVTPVSVDGSPTTVSDPRVELEAVLDIDMMIGVNPHIEEVRVYEDSIDPFPVALLDAISAVGDEDQAEVFSISYGLDEGYQGKKAIAAENNALMQLAAEGITVTASSGDNGAYGDGYSQPYNVSDPASQPYITGVGGTTLFTGPGQAYIEEQAWNQLPNGYGATGGGISAYWPIPAYQSTEVPSDYVTVNGGSAKRRNVPDIAALGDPLTGVGVYSKINGGWIQIGGTSVSSPIWASYLSIIDAAFNYAGLGNLGFFNPILYAVGTPDYGIGYPASFLYDIIAGSNGWAAGYGGYPGYINGLGYSNTTGSGSIWGSGFALQLMISGMQPGKRPSQILYFNVSKTTATTASFSWSASERAAGYVFGLFNNGIYGWVVTEAVVTKDTKVNMAGLTPGQEYWASVWAFNSSGGSLKAGPVYIQTPK
jgi:kumamolisin